MYIPFRGRASIMIGVMLATAAVLAMPRSMCSAFGAGPPRRLASPALRGPSRRRLFRTHLEAVASPPRALPSPPPPPPGPADRTPVGGDVVTVEWTVTPRNGLVVEPLFDASGTVAFVLGGGNYLPALHELVGDLRPGEAVQGKVIDAGWGERNPALIATMPKGGQEGMDYDRIVSGVELELANGVRCVVTGVTDTEFTIDANPPLAGATYSADVKLLSVEEGVTDLLFRGEGGQTGRYEVATFALGCFWGVELEYMRVPGVVGTRVGFTQGKVSASAGPPTYEQVCTGDTGHAEAVMVTFDPKVVQYRRLVQIAMDRLDENKYLLNQVGNDRGTQYRHGIYYHTEDQRKVGREVLNSFGDNCRTELERAGVFYDAEAYHQQYLYKGGQSARKGEETQIRCYG